jgi:DNA-binding beta-propeller fold protein YncE
MSLSLQPGPAVGSGRFRYRVEPDWGRLPPGWSLVEVAGVATDSQGRVYVFNRGTHPIIIFDRAGRFLASWGEGMFRRAHGICIGPDGAVYCTDDLDHTVRKLTPDGQLLLTVGISGKPSETGIVGIDYRTLRRSGLPFHRPTNTALAPDGALLITDGYGNARVHRFSPDGRHLSSWGEPGTEPGQFNLPHGIAVDRDGRVYVADRENSRIQVFSADGAFLEQWRDVVRPTEVFIDEQDNVFVSELGWRAGLFPWHEPPADGPGGRLSIFTRAGQLQARWGGGPGPCAAGDFFAPHDVWVDAEGAIYVGEVIASAAGGRPPAGARALQKFVPERDGA